MDLTPLLPIIVGMSAPRSGESEASSDKEGFGALVDAMLAGLEGADVPTTDLPADPTGEGCHPPVRAPSEDEAPELRPLPRAGIQDPPSFHYAGLYGEGVVMPPITVPGPEPGIRPRIAGQEPGALELLGPRTTRPENRPPAQASALAQPAVEEPVPEPGDGTEGDPTPVSGTRPTGPPGANPGPVFSSPGSVGHGGVGGNVPETEAPRPALSPADDSAEPEAQTTVGRREIELEPPDPATAPSQATSSPFAPAASAPVDRASAAEVIDMIQEWAERVDRGTHPESISIEMPDPDGDYLIRLAMRDGRLEMNITRAGSEAPTWLIDQLDEALARHGFDRTDDEKGGRRDGEERQPFGEQPRRSRHRRRDEEGLWM